MIVKTNFSLYLYPTNPKHPIHPGSDILYNLPKSPLYLRHENNTYDDSSIGQSEEILFNPKSC